MAKHIQFAGRRGHIDMTRQGDENGYWWRVTYGRTTWLYADESDARRRAIREMMADYTDDSSGDNVRPVVAARQPLDGPGAAGDYREVV